jgi:septum site-determining protein MinC
MGFYYRDTSQSKKELIAKETEKQEPVNETDNVVKSCENEANLIINRNVRSGQQIYAKNRSVIIFGNISSGAEVIADGNILVIGSLKGKAIAGANGDKGAIIQANKMEPELLSIAGVFLTSEDLDDFEGVYGSSAICKMDEHTEDISFVK